MITSENIGDFIKNPELIISGMAKDLDEIKKKYPYCSTLYLLHLKGLAIANDIHFEENLKLAAAHAMDSEKMFKLIHSIKSVEKEKEEEVILDEKKNITEDVLTEDVQDSESKNYKREDVEDVELEKDSFSENQIKDKLETNIISHAVDIAFEFSAEEVISNDEGKPTNQITEVEKEVELPQINPENFSFIEWLQFKQNEVGVDTDFDKSEIEFGIPEPEVSKKQLTKNEIDNLLDKFIAEEPSLSKPKTEFFSPSKNAKKSIEDNSIFVTETLAEIYFLQKNYSKAIASFEQLILVYPEKKTFFANRIKKIKKEQNN